MEVYLVDMFGEFGLFYCFVDFVFIGGFLIEYGG